MLRTALCCAALALVATCDADPPPRTKLVLVGEPDPPSSRLGEIRTRSTVDSYAPSADGMVAINAELYDLVDRKTIRRQSLDLGPTAGWLRSNDGKRAFAFREAEGCVVVLDGRADWIRLDGRTHRPEVAHLSLASYPSYVTTCGTDGKAIRWSGRDGRWLDTFHTGHEHWNAVDSCMSKDGRHVAVAFFDPPRTDWFALDGKRVRRIGSMRGVEPTQFLRSGHLVVSRSGSDPLVLDPRTGRLASPQPPIPNEAMCPAEHVDRGRSDPDDDFSAWVNDREWLLDGQHASRYATHAGWLATFDACGRRLRLFERNTGQMLWERTLWDTAPNAWMGGPVFSPRGDVLCATVGRDVRFWDVCTGRPLGRMRVGEMVDCQPPAFAPDGTAVGVVPSWEAGYPMVLPVPRPVPDPSDATLAEMWRRLGGDAPVAYRAARAIAHRGADGAAFVAAQMSAVPLPTAAELQAWHERLDAPDYRTRTAAQHAFAALPHPASVAESLRKHPVNADARRFLDRIVEQERRAPTTAEELRAARAVTALELIGEPALPTLLAWAARDDSRQARAAREAAVRVRAARYRP